MDQQTFAVIQIYTSEISLANIRKLLNQAILVPNDVYSLRNFNCLFGEYDHRLILFALYLVIEFISEWLCECDPFTANG